MYAWRVALVTIGIVAVGCESPTARATTTYSEQPLQAQAISVGGQFACAIAVGGAAYCWGNDANGQLGNDSATNASGGGELAPEAVAGQLTFQSISAGAFHACGITTSGATYCWGQNDAGQLGDGTTTNRSVPVAVKGGVVFQSVVAADDDFDEHSCGLTAAGAAYCWGGNTYGEIGDGSTINRLTPVAVAGGLVFRSLAAGEIHVCGLTTAGAAYCWGDNYNGELGTGDTIHRFTPAPVAGGLTFASLVTGERQSCGLTSSGAAYCWGQNNAWQLGDGSDTNRVAPVPVVGALTFQSVAAGGTHTCGLESGGIPICWGIWPSLLITSASVGEDMKPTLILGGIAFQSISAGDSQTCGLTSAGVVYCWGTQPAAVDSIVVPSTASRRHGPP